MRKLFLPILLLLGLGVATADNPHVPRGPVIVADQSFLNQNGNIASTAIFTPSSAGLYRVVAYEEVIPFDATSAVNVNANWTDNSRTNGVNLFSGAFFGQGSVVVHSVSGSPIDISAQVSLASGATYNLFVLVEQL